VAYLCLVRSTIVANTSWVTLFQWLSLTGSILAVVSLVGLWVFTGRVDQEKELQIQRLQSVTEAVRGFSDIATLNPAGLPFRERSGIRYDSPLSTALRDLYVTTDSTINFKLGLEFEPRYKRIVEQFPRFPFAYVALAESMRYRGDSSWREYAQKAVSILEKTTTIDGHDRSHDDALATMRDYLSAR
jgi:hypothetical protein